MKDYFLNLGGAQARAANLDKWQQANAALSGAIADFAAASEDRQRAAGWGEDHAHYQAGFALVVQGVNSGQITSAAAANAALLPVKDPIRILTDTATSVAHHKAEIAQQVGSAFDALPAASGWCC